MTLQRSKPGAGIASLAGRIAVEWTNDCDGFSFNQRFYSRMGDSQGNQTVSDRWVTSWESRSGDAFNFSLTDYADGSLFEKAKGRADRANGEGQGFIHYQEPKSIEIEIPRDIIFPTEHTFALINAALAEKRALTRTVFDGSSDGALYDVVAFIGDRQTSGDRPDLSDVDGGDQLKSVKSWPVRVAYFEHGSTSEAPQYEFGFVIYENGVSADLLIDYEEFSIAGRLGSLETIGAKKCD